jgi:ATP-binding cassette, subfamily B, bacterial
VKLLRRFLLELKPYTGLLIFVGFLTYINARLSLLIPNLIGQLFNFLDKKHPMQLDVAVAQVPLNIGGLLVAVLSIALLSATVGYIMTVTTVSISQKFAYQMRRKLYAHLQLLSQGYFEKAQTGKLVATIVNDIGQVNQLINGGFTTIIQDGVTLIGVLYLIFHQSPVLSGLALLVYPIYIINYYLSRRYLKENSEKISELRGVIYSDLQEKLAGVQVVKSYAQERSEVRAYTSLNRENLNLNNKQNHFGTILWVRAEVISAIGTAIILCVGGKLVIEEKLGQGDLVAFLLLVTNFLYAPTVRLIQQYDQIARTQTGLNRIFNLLDTATAVQNDATKPALPPIAGRIRYENVWFAYEPEQFVIKGITLDIQPGQMIAFVGGSGSGKTTMISLLSRHYDVTRGAITIDGHDLRDIELISLRQQIGVVLQESVLFHTTIKENLRYGRLNATDAEIIAAARAANIHQVIEALPNGYETKIGEEGTKLSVGEKQRLAIARALLADPRILVLDEATSSLDSETEALIQDALDTLMKGRTSFVIAHRLSTIVKADKIVVMEKGEIKEVAGHAELLESGGIYARLYAEQFRAELEAAVS